MLTMQQHEMFTSCLLQASAVLTPLKRWKWSAQSASSRGRAPRTAAQQLWHALIIALVRGTNPYSHGEGVLASLSTFGDLVGPYFGHSSFESRNTALASLELLGVSSIGTGNSDMHVDVEEGLGEELCEAEAPRPLRWNQPAVVIIACCIIIGVLGSGVGYAIRCTHLLWTCGC